MKYLSIACLSLAVSIGATTVVKAQGEGDPGFSTIGALRSNSAVMIDDEVYENNKTQFGVSHTFAKGDRDAVLNIPAAELRVAIADFGYIDAKLPIYSAKGDLARVWGLGDLSVAYTHMFPNYEGFTYQVTGGLQIGTGTAALTDGKGRPLPMVYQSSRGTTDVILGASMTWKKYVTLAVGYQQPFIQYNQNTYRGRYVNNESVYSTNDYPITRNLYRGGDLMFRLEGSYYGKRAGIAAGPLAIYHLRNDLYEDINNVVREHQGTEGFTLNIGGNAFYRLGRYANWKIDVSAAMPISQRDLRPEGLSREWLIIPRVTYFFNQENVLFN